MKEDKFLPAANWKSRYSYAFKMEVVESVENGKFSQNQASKVFGVHRRTIYRWMKNYGNFEKKLREMGGKSAKQTVADLRAKLRVSECENEVLKAVLDIIQDEYGEEVVKKYLPESLLRTTPTRRKK